MSPKSGYTQLIFWTPRDLLWFNGSWKSSLKRNNIIDIQEREHIHVIIIYRHHTCTKREQVKDSWWSRLLLAGKEWSTVLWSFNDCLSNISLPCRPRIEKGRRKGTEVTHVLKYTEQKQKWLFPPHACINLPLKSLSSFAVVFYQ